MPARRTSLGDGNKNVGLLIHATTGTIAGLYDYDSFGENLQASGESVDVNPFRFSSKYRDNESGLSYYGLRYYSAQKGRWINRDPIEESGGVNLYAFVNNNGVDTTDLLGLCPEPKNVTLSIDDGPLSANADMREFLRQNNIKTTFFVVGTAVQAREADLLAIVRDGHSLANHTWSHPDLTTLRTEQVKSQLTRLDDLIKRLTNRSMAPNWRPPYGAKNQRVTAAANSVGFTKMWMWDVDSLDWHYRGATQSIVNKVMSGLRGCKKDTCHILFHDHATTVKALRALMPKLEAENYKVVPFTF